MVVRKPAVAGAFYPGDIEELKRYLDSVLGKETIKIKPKAVIVPHAGYIYSGHVAAKVYDLLEPFETYIILGPNHTGWGEEISVFSGVYQMPFGDVETDDELARIIVDNSTARFDYYAHLQEHSIEVQLPFVDYISLGKPYRIVPIVVGTHNRKKLRMLGHAMAKAVYESHRDVLIVVSSDMNHYESQEITLKKDEIAIEAILRLDEEKLMDVVEAHNISMCGAAGSYAAIVAAKELGATEAHLVDHRTSGDVNGDYSQVVGYASLVIE